MSGEVVTTVVSAAANYDLTDLASVHLELSIPDGTTKDDGWLRKAISQVSKSVANDCNRVFQVEALQDIFYLQYRNVGAKVRGKGEILQLDRWPLVSVTSVVGIYASLTSTTLVQGTDYAVNAELGQLIRLNADTGQPVQWRESEVVVNYVAGYGDATTQVANVPANPGPYVVTVTNAGTFSIDQGVKYSVSGIALAEVTGTPSAGQYAVDPTTGKYTFAAADTGLGVVIAYAYNEIPTDIVDATLRVITGRFTARGRDPMVMTQTQQGLGERRYWVGTAPGQVGPFAPEIAGLLDNYRVPVVG